MPFDKLYVKIKCPTCKGTRSLYGTEHQPPPTSINRWSECNYCDHDGLSLIEAGDYVIIQHLIDLPAERRDLILDHFKKSPKKK